MRYLPNPMEPTHLRADLPNLPDPVRPSDVREHMRRHLPNLPDAVPAGDVPDVSDAV